MKKIDKRKGLHLNLNKEQTRVGITIAVSVAISVFCLTATKVLLSNGAYKRQVINARHQSADQLKQNVTNAQNLLNQFQVFEGDNPKNIIGGQNTTSQKAVPPDGNNSRIVLDALPSTYDFPALITSMAKILHARQLSNPDVSGSDQGDTVSGAPSAQPQPISIPLTISGSGNYKTVQNLITDLERSIRPFDITTLSLQGTSGNFAFSAVINTYYQPAKILTITNREVK